MEASATELRKKMDRKRDNLTKLLIETLLPLKNSPITADRIESLFRSKDKEIYEPKLWLRFPHQQLQDQHM